jgi:uncharacterized protein YbaP (TraB family)
MSERAIRCLSFFFVLLVLNHSPCASDAASQDQKNFLWKVESKTGAVYLLGSLHFLKKEAYPLNRTIEDAFERSDVLAVEANVNDIKQIDISKFMENALYPDDDTLEKHVSRETYALTKKEFEGLGLPIELAKKEKPWFLALTLSSLELLRSGFDPNYGIDMHFLSKAKERKRIVELESLDYQIKLLSGFSDSEQEDFLLYTLNDTKTVREATDELLQAWETGDVKKLESVLAKYAGEGEGTSPFYEKLIFERNRTMALKIEEFLKTKETYFVVVGAGHLVGDKGIIELLRRKGYRVKQL